MMMVLLVPRFLRAGTKRPVNSIKHILDVSGVLTGGVASVANIAVAVPNADTTTFKPGDIRVGGTVNGFFLSIFVIGATGAPLNGPIDWYIMKTHDGQDAGNPAPGATGVSSRRNQIIHEEKGLAGSGDGTPMAFKGVVAVPRGMRRFREGDGWRVTIVSADATSDAQFCIKAIYKSYF